MHNAPAVAKRATMIDVQGLSKIFGDPKSDKAVRAVDDVTFTVNAGEIFAFLGPNGAGKTTTIQMLTTLLKPARGVHRRQSHRRAARRVGARRPLVAVLGARRLGVLEDSGLS